MINEIEGIEIHDVAKMHKRPHNFTECSDQLVKYKNLKSSSTMNDVIVNKSIGSCGDEKV